MFKVERYFSGSVVDNLIEDDLTCRNYLALYCCLLGITKNGKKIYPKPEENNANQFRITEDNEANADATLKGFTFPSPQTGLKGDVSVAWSIDRKSVV